MHSPARPPAHDRTSADEARLAARALLAYCRERRWAGHDPYDALNSRLFTAVPLFDSRLPRLALTQALKRSPLNLRAAAFIPKSRNPKAIALFLGALVRMTDVPAAERRSLVTELVDHLIALRSPLPNWCWGYDFPWQTRTAVVPRWTPNAVCTSFVADALLDVYESGGDGRCLTMAVSAARFILDALYWTAGPAAAGFAYPLAADRVPIHNANLLAAALLCRVHRLTGDRRFLEPALRVARGSAARQREDGSWFYGEAPTQRWIDNFHTGYNLCALEAIGRDLDSGEFDAHVSRGFRFYRDRFFTADGAARYFHDSTYPIDIHSIAQSLITLVELRRLDADSLRLAESVLRWTMARMWDRRGFFYYRVLRLGTIRTSYMRWSQAWMLRALATFMRPESAAIRRPAVAAAASV